MVIINKLKKKLQEISEYSVELEACRREKQTSPQSFKKIERL